MGLWDNEVFCKASGVVLGEGRRLGGLIGANWINIQLVF